MDSIYSIRELSFSYNNNDVLFSNVNIDIPTKGITILVGTNGTGKTTFCRLLTSLTKGYKGCIYFQNKDLSTVSPSSLLDCVLYVKQDLTGNIMGLTPDEDLKIWQNRFHYPDTLDKAELREEAFQMIGASSIRNEPIWNLSYGQKRRTMLATMPLFREKYWIMDEPSASLDTDGIHQLIQLLNLKLTTGYGALILTHRIDLFNDLLKINQISPTVESQKTAKKYIRPNNLYIIKDQKIIPYDPGIS